MKLLSRPPTVLVSAPAVLVLKINIFGSNIKSEDGLTDLIKMNVGVNS